MPVLSHDGHDLAPALQTIIENGDDRLLAEAVGDAFDGARLHIYTEQTPALTARFHLQLDSLAHHEPLTEGPDQLELKGPNLIPSQHQGRIADQKWTLMAR